MAVIILLIWLVCGIIAASIASGKGRSGCGWFILGLIFGPLALLVAAAMTTDQRAINRIALGTGAMRSCPHCAEPIQREAKVCRYCGRDVPALPVDAGGFAAWASEDPKRTGITVAGMILLIVVLLLSFSKFRRADALIDQETNTVNGLNAPQETQEITPEEIEKLRKAIRDS